MRAFFIGLQFLTRISIVEQKDWCEKDFADSVRYFPLIGLVLGIIYTAFAALLLILLPQNGFLLPHHVVAAALLILPILLTGGLHCDGFMDTMDGVFSGRERERKLEIMKDSRVGSFGVVAFVSLFALNVSLLFDMKPDFAMLGLFLMPIIGRLAMTTVISFFPYARKEGMGKAFADSADTRTFLSALVFAAIFILPNGELAAIALGVGLLFAFVFASFVKGELGGLTGDVYGATTMLTETLVLIVMLIASHWMESPEILWLLLC